MKHKLIAASLFLAFTAPAALADGQGQRGARILERLDTDGDGRISLSEFRFPGDRMIKEADTDGDGAVTMEEMKAFHEQRMEERMEERQDRMRRHADDQAARLDEMFKSMDTDGNGAVTAEEARTAAFNRMDANGDGFLSADEFRPPRRGHGHGRRGDDDAPPPPGDDF